MAAEIASREPEVFAAGDSLIFQRYLPDYLPSEGWELEYTLTDGAGVVRAEVTSTDSNDYHLVDQDGFAAGLAAARYVLAGFATKDAERHQIYYGEFTLTADLTANAAADITTHAQRMVGLLEASLERLAAHELSETDVERSKIVRAKRQEILDQLKYYRELRAWEIKQENIRNGRPSGALIAPLLRIT